MLHNLTTLEVATALVEEVVCAAALVPVDLAILSSLVVATIVQEPSRGGVCLVFGTCVVANVDAEIICCSVPTRHLQKGERD